MFLYKNLFFFNIFCYFNPNHAYWNQRRLFSGNLPGMFSLRLKFLQVDEGLLRDKITCYDHFMSYTVLQTNTQNDTSF